MTTCPLPVDWLDLLAGRLSVASRAHLDSCPSCRAVVESIDDAETEAPNLTALSELAAETRRDFSLAGSPSEQLPSIGDIFWLVVDNNLALRLLVLILDGLDESAEPAFDVAPLWVDDDNAVPGDLLLNGADSTTGIRWRVAFRHQTVVAGSALDSRVGRLTDSGQASLAEALTGFIPAASTGVPLESDFDPRLRADGWIREPLMAAAASVDEDDLEGSDQHTEFAAFVFELTRKNVESRSSYRLAAARPDVGKSVIEAVLHRHDYSIHVVARLWLDSKSDQLRLRPLEVSGLAGRVFLVLHSRYLDKPVEVETTLNVDEEVTLASGVGISERDIDSMEMQLR